MICESCGVEMVERSATADAPYQYKISGVRNLFLAGISIFECPACGEKSPVIPRVGELHRVIARAFIGKDGALTGEEIRFLRKNAGISSVRFAALLGVGHVHLSKVENGLRKLGPTADKMVRILSEVSSDGEHIREILLKQADKKIEKAKEGKGSERSVFKLGNDRWQQLNIAA